MIALLRSRWTPLVLVCLGTLAAGVGWALGDQPHLLLLTLWGVVTALALAWRPLAEGRLPLLALSAVVALGACHVLAHEGKTGDVFGQKVWWLDDDMMISLRYGRNLAAGDGLVWNAGERVEGYTNFLWTLGLALPHWVLPPETVSLAVILANTGLLLLLLLAVHRALTQAGASGFACGVATLLLATSPAVLNWTVGGGESVLLALGLVVLARGAVRPPTTSRGTWGLGLLAGACVLVRPDAVVAVAALLLGAAWRRQGRPRLLLLAGCALVLPVLQLCFRLWYYGEWLPNTWYLKGTGWDGRTEAGLRYAGDLLADHWPLLMLAVFAVLARRGRWPWLLAVLGHLAYVVQVGGDELPQQRFFVPVLPLLAVLAVEGAAAVGRWWNQRVGGEAASGSPVLVPALVLGWAGFHGAVLPGTVPADMERRATSERFNAMVGYLLRENTLPEARIAHFWAGAAPYFSERPAIDLFGKCDPHVARTTAHPGLKAPGHAKFDLDHSLGLAPDVIVGGDPAALNAQQIEARRRSDYRAFAELVLHPEFRAKYAPGVVGRVQRPDNALWVSRNWHGIYVRAGTALARPPRAWQPPD